VGRARRCESAVRTVDRFDPTPFRTHIAAQVDGFEPTDYMERHRARRTERYAQFSLAASRHGAGRRGDRRPRPRTRTGWGADGERAGRRGVRREPVHLYVTAGSAAWTRCWRWPSSTGAASCNVAIEFGFTGPNSTNGMSCASGAIALGDAWRLIRGGEADLVLAGGVEAPLAPLCFGAFAIIRAMSTRNDDPDRLAPLRRRARRVRDGRGGGGAGAGGDGARPRPRRAHLRELLGYGTSNDAHHMTAPRPDGARPRGRCATRSDGGGPRRTRSTW
jgi:3-oxoacyl-[acyl-carrier-protein] synthase II